MRRSNNHLNKDSKRYTLPPKWLRISLFLPEYCSSRSHQTTSLLANLRNRRSYEISAAAVKCFAPCAENNAFERCKSPASNHITTNCGACAWTENAPKYSRGTRKRSTAKKPYVAATNQKCNRKNIPTKPYVAAINQKCNQNNITMVSDKTTSTAFCAQAYSQKLQEAHNIVKL